MTLEGPWEGGGDTTLLAFGGGVGVTTRLKERVTKVKDWGLHWEQSCYD